MRLKESEHFQGSKNFSNEPEQNFNQALVNNYIVNDNQWKKKISLEATFLLIKVEPCTWEEESGVLNVQGQSWLQVRLEHMKTYFKTKTRNRSKTYSQWV